MSNANEAKELVAKAQEAKNRAYAPYSKFRVGAALMTKCGQVFTGCNVENASYSMTICAERTAVVKAVSEGYRDYKACAVITDQNQISSPCGACRQVLREFGEDIVVYCADTDGKYETFTVKSLLPHSFGPGDLDH